VRARPLSSATAQGGMRREKDATEKSERRGDPSSVILSPDLTDIDGARQDQLLPPPRKMIQAWHLAPVSYLNAVSGCASDHQRTSCNRCVIDDDSTRHRRLPPRTATSHSAGCCCAAY
jgi:hypothetical protein